MKRTTASVRSVMAVSAVWVGGAGALLAACGGGSHAVATGTGGMSDFVTGGSGGESPSTGGAAGNAGTTSNGGAAVGLPDAPMCSPGAPLPQIVDRYDGPVCDAQLSQHCATFGTNDKSCPASVPQAPNCASDDKGRPAEECGVLVSIDSTVSQITRSTSTREFMGSGPPDVSCFNPATWRVAGTPKMVTVAGWARNFANGCDSKGSQISIYTVKRTGDSHDGEIDQLVGTPVQVTGDPCTPTTCKEETNVTVCSGAAINNTREWRAYSYPNVPSETELLVKTEMSQTDPGDYATLYDYNLYIPNSDPGVTANGVFAHDVRVIDSGDYTLIPTTAGVGQINPGNGAIAGEVHDCGNVRIIGATVDVSVSRAQVGYFTSNESDPLPDINANSTSVLGTYAAYNTPAGRARVAAVGVLNDANGKAAVQTLGYYDVQVYPNSITSITFQGLQPFQSANWGK